MRSKNSYQTFMLLLFFSFFALAITAPLSSFKYTPAGDFHDHAKAIVLAKNALAEHQFPIRIAPDITNNPRYALFQFYSPFPYMIAGFLYTYICKGNPYVHYKLLTWSALILGGMFIYRICQRLTKNKKAALLAGLAYQFSSYWIINTNIRTDFTESIAQGFLPVALYYSFYIFQRHDTKRFMLAAISWAILAMTHLITFAYGLVFFLIFTSLTTIVNKKITGLVRVILSISLGGILALWYLAPIILIHPILGIFLDKAYPFKLAFLTPFTSLIATQSVSPIPLPANGELGIEYLYPAVGYAVLIGIGVLIYIFYKDREFYKKNSALMPLMLTFFLAFFATWSPLNFWEVLPAFLSFFQFTYRLLTPVMWLGAILLAFALSGLYKKGIEDGLLLILICVIVIGNSAWIHTQKNDGTTIRSEVLNNYQSHLATDYQVHVDKVPKETILSNSQLIHSCTQEHKTLTCHINVTRETTHVALPMLWYPEMISIKINNHLSPYYPTIQNKKVMVGLKLTPNQYTIQATFVGFTWANWLSLLGWSYVAISLAILIFSRKPTPVGLTRESCYEG